MHFSGVISSRPVLELWVLIMSFLCTLAYYIKSLLQSVSCPVSSRKLRYLSPLRAGCLRIWPMMQNGIVIRDSLNSGSIFSLKKNKSQKLISRQILRKLHHRSKISERKKVKLSFSEIDKTLLSNYDIISRKQLIFIWHV